jgi:hypothetical protein
MPATAQCRSKIKPTFCLNERQITRRWSAVTSCTRYPDEGLLLLLLLLLLLPIGTRVRARSFGKSSHTLQSSCTIMKRIVRNERPGKGAFVVK